MSTYSLDHSKSSNETSSAVADTPSSLTNDDATAVLLSTRGIPHAHHDSIPISNSSIHHNTREEILKLFDRWITTTTRAQDKPPILWFAGPSGIGKTTVQLHLARHWSKEGRVLASCFFSDNSVLPPEEIVGRFVVTLAHQIALNVPGLWTFVSRAIRDDPEIFSRRPQDQMTALVLRPLGELVRYAKKQKLWWRRYKAILGGQSPSTDTQQYIAFNSMHEDWQHRNVVVVDGLDEITGREAQERIVGIMEWATMQRPLPLRFIVSSSKSEGDHVVRKAMANLSQETCRLVTLGGSPIDNDILVFLNDEFARIQKEFSNRGGGSIPAEGWPGVGIVKKLVTNARGLFVYASTLVKLMDTPSRDPVLVLQQVLDASPQVDSTARYEQSYTELDALYSIILHPPDTDLDLIRRLLHAVMFSKDPFGSTSELEEQLLLHPGSVEAVLRDLHSIVSLPLETQTIRFHHRTIRDYLLSRERSRDMYIES